MILGDDRRAVIENIKTYAENGDFYHKVELHDPVLTSQQCRAITDAYVENRKRVSYRIKSMAAIGMTQTATRKINRTTEIRGLEKIPADIGGVIVTSNHFSPLENTVVRHLTNRMGKKLSIISQTSNFAMPGFIGFLMNYANTIPISTDPQYLAKDFLKTLQEKLVTKREAVLLYPEQEMWFHYRKPRPPKNGAYFFAAKLNVPILSCFVEIVDTDKDDNSEFRKVRYVLHVLDVLYPDKNMTAKTNMLRLAEQDYALKKQCYESVYGKPLTYDFEDSDIAGWKGSL